jgi:uncharacterized protein
MSEHARVEVRHEPERSRWAAYVDGEEAGYADYVLLEDPPRVLFPHTVTHPAYGGRGVASQVVAAALEHVRADGGRQVLPQCWFVARHIDQHPDLAGLLEAPATGAANGL